MYCSTTAIGDEARWRSVWVSSSNCNYGHQVKKKKPILITMAASSSRLLSKLWSTSIGRHHHQQQKLLFRLAPSPQSYSFRGLSIVVQMQDSTVKMEVDVPVSVAYKCYSDRESIPLWMPFISSVKVVEDKPDLSRWSLKYQAFGQDIRFSWLARNLQPIPNKKIHWRSLEGLPNSGAVRFFPKGPSSCLIELTVSYEVPQILMPVASALEPFLQSLLLRGLERFSEFAKSRLPDKTA